MRDMTKLNGKGHGRLGAFLAAAIAAAAGFGDGAPAQAQSVLRVIPLNDLKILDPIWATGYTSRDHGYMIFDTLFGTDENLKVQPQMVDTWSVSPDNLTWTFTLRDGLKFHDGAPVTSEDCIQSLKRWAARDTHGQLMMGFIAGWEAKDAKTFSIKLNKPFGLMLDILGKPGLIPPFIMPKRMADTDPFTAIKESVGSGPFIFKADEWVLGSKVVYVKNPNYVPRKEPPSGTAGAKLAKVDRVEWMSIFDTAIAANAISRGEVHYWLQPPQDLYKTLSANPRVKLEPNDPYGTLGIFRMNHHVAPFNNRKLRQAVLKAVDQTPFMLAAVGDQKYFKTCYSLYACGSPWESAAGAEKLKNHNIEEAKKLVKESGYKGERIPILQSVDNQMLSNFSLVAADLFKQIGLNAELQAMDFQTLVARRARKEPVDQGGWAVFFTNGISSDFFDPYSILFSASGEKGWPGWVDEPEIENLKRDFANELDSAKKKAIIDKLQLLGLDTVTYVPMGIAFYSIAYRDNVKGILRSPLNLYWNISVE